MSTKIMRQEATALLAKAEQALNEDDVEGFNGMIVDAQTKMEKADQLDAAVEEVLADLRKGGPNALGFAKRLVYEVPRMEQKEAFEWTSRLSAKLFRGDEAAEGMAAFLGRRKASWAEDSEES